MLKITWGLDCWVHWNINYMCNKWCIKIFIYISTRWFWAHMNTVDNVFVSIGLIYHYLNHMKSLCAIWIHFTNVFDDAVRENIFKYLSLKILLLLYAPYCYGLESRRTLDLSCELAIQQNVGRSTQMPIRAENTAPLMCWCDVKPNNKKKNYKEI
jgi:hypothetical protein